MRKYIKKILIFPLIILSLLLCFPIFSGCDNNGGEPLKLLFVGNSYSQDTKYYMYEIARSLGVDVRICNMYVGACAIDGHWANTYNGTSPYDFEYYSTDWQSTVNWSIKKNCSLEYGITADSWDYICLQQASAASGLPETYTHLNDLIAWIKEKAVNPNVKFLWNMTWAYKDNSGHPEFPKYDNSEQKMYNAIIDTVKSQVLNKDFYKILPVGTALENARTSYLGKSFMRDMYCHLSFEQTNTLSSYNDCQTNGRFIAGLTAFCALTGKDVEKVTYKPRNLTETSFAIYKDAVKKAISKPYEVTESSYSENNIRKNFTKKDITFHEFAFYNSLGKGAELVTDSPICNNYISTPVFDRNTLPVGSFIIIEDGFKYRPEGWEENAAQTDREDEVTFKIVCVSEDWWKAYMLRGFNVSSKDGGSLVGKVNAAKSAFSIYIPKK